MIRGARILLVGGCLAASACAQNGNLKVRAIADPSAKLRFGGGLLSDARAQLALGDVGIALETFRTFSRQQPENPDAYAGIAACYAAMGRYDIARQNYEIALAYAPNDPTLLLGLAGSLDRLGEVDQAAQVRSEAARLRTQASAPSALAEARPTPLGVPRTASVTVKLPAASAAKADTARPTRPAVAEVVRPVAVVEKAPVPEIAAPDPTAKYVSLVSAPMTPQSTKIASSAELPLLQRQEPDPATINLPKLTPAEVRLSAAPIAPKMTRTAVNGLASIPTIAAPEPMSPAIAPRELTPAAVRLSAAPLVPNTVEAAPNTVEAAANALLSMSAPVVTPRPSVALATISAKPTRAPAAAPEPAMASGPYLQRMSTSEVSLVTNPAMRVQHSWPKLPQVSLPTQSEMVKASAPAQPAPRLAMAWPLRWVPLRYASAPVNIQLLNAGRIQSLAAHARVALLDRGWRKIGIGNARFVRQRTVVLYAPTRAAIAHRLAAQFRCKSLKVNGIRSVVVLLGRDSTLRRRSSASA